VGLGVGGDGVGDGVICVTAPHLTFHLRSAHM
jgi:hypothetical protein